MQTNILEYLEATVLRLPDKIAYSNGKEHLTFSELSHHARAIGSALLEKGYTHVPIAILMEKHPNEVAAFFGTVYAGCFYVPLDPEMPVARIETILESVGANLLIVDKKGRKIAETLHFPIKVIDFEVYVNGEFLNAYSADGVIIATATGSTAYSLSAGGPIVQPNAEIMMITPICPHTLNKRSIILSKNDTIEIVMSDNKGLKEERVASFDGELFCKMVTGDRIVIRRADAKADFIKTNKLSFLQLISKKMNNN